METYKHHIQKAQSKRFSPSILSSLLASHILYIWSANCVPLGFI